MKRFARGMIAGLLVGLPLLVSPPVRASFIPIFNPSTSNPSAGTFVYTGSFTNSPNNDPTDPLRNGKPVEQLSPFTPAPPGPSAAGATGSFFTIYDLPALSMVTIDPAFTGLFNFVTLTTGTTPANVTPNPADNPAMTNVTVYYTGTTNTSLNGATFANLLKIQVAPTVVVGINTNGQFSYQTGASTGNTQPLDTPLRSISNNLFVPAIGAVPEPASVVMMSFGGLGVGALALFFRRKAEA